MVTLKVGSRRWMRQVALLVAGAVLAMQSVLAAQACALPLPVSDTPMVAAQCEDAGMGSASSCLIQCQKTADQIKPSIDFHFDALPTPHLWSERLFLPRATSSVAIDRLHEHRAAGASLQILFCTFQS